MKQFGLKPSKSYNGMHSVSSFYMENDAIILIFNKGKASKWLWWGYYLYRFLYKHYNK